MSDPFDLPAPSPEPEAGQPSADAEAFPWEADYADDPEAPRQRHDAFNSARKRDFLKALVKTGCILDACRKIGVSSQTVYRHQEQDRAFFNYCAAALRMCEMPVEITAWQRAVEGTEEHFAAGGKVYTRTRYSDNLLRLLLQGSNPRKYGPRPGFKRKRLLKHEKKQMEREIRAEIAARRKAEEPSIEQVTETIVARVGAIERHREREQLAAGWTRIELEGREDGYMIPPGYGPIDGTPRDSM